MSCGHQSPDMNKQSMRGDTGSHEIMIQMAVDIELFGCNLKRQKYIVYILSLVSGSFLKRSFFCYMYIQEEIREILYSFVPLHVITGSE